MMIKKSFLKDSLNNSLSNSLALGKAQDILMDQKKDNLIGLMDSILRRNREDNDDSVLFEDDMPMDVICDEVADLGNGPNFRRSKIDFLYNRNDHELTKLFMLIA